MAIVQMIRRKAAAIGYEYAETIADGEDGDTIQIFPMGPGLAKVTCRIITGSNTGKFQFTTSLDADVLAGTAVWSDWAKGDITGTDWDVLLSQVTGLRGVSVSGEVKIEVIL